MLEILECLFENISSLQGIQNYEVFIAKGRWSNSSLKRHKNNREPTKIDSENVTKNRSHFTGQIGYW